MTITALSLALSLTISSAAPAVTASPSLRQTPPLSSSFATLASHPVGPAAARWTTDARHERPVALPVLYGTLGALQVADAYSTRRAISAGAVEANPLMKGAARSSGAMYAVKAASTVAAVYFAERAWKKNRTAAVVMMTAINGVSAAIVAHNLRNAR